MLIHAAEERIQNADLSGIEIFTHKDYGATQLSQWANRKYGIAASPQEILAAINVEKPRDGEEDKTPLGLLMSKARELFRRREIEEPVEFALQMTMMLAQQSRDEAASQLVTWANRKYQLGWSTDELRKSTPAKVKTQLLEANTRFVNDKVMEKEIAAAQACKTDDDLDAYLIKRFEVGLPDNMRHLRPDERPNAIQARVENILRAELLAKERQIFLDVLGNSWRDHLYAMDQLRDSIGFRAFSQQDPRIEYKREGSHMFRAMLESVRDKITDLVFKTKLNFGTGPRRPAPMQRPPQAQPISAQASLDGPGGPPANRPDDGML